MTTIPGAAGATQQEKYQQHQDRAETAGATGEVTTATATAKGEVTTATARAAGEVTTARASATTATGAADAAKADKKSNSNKCMLTMWKAVHP